MTTRSATYPFNRMLGDDGRMRADHDDVMRGLRNLATERGWYRKVDADGNKDGGWTGPDHGQRLPFL